MGRESQSKFYIFGGQMIQLRFGNLSSNKDNIMKKFNPVEYNRQLWGDFKRTKNHPKSCTKDHKYCHIPYEWGEDRVYANSLACLANDSTLVLPPREEDPVIPSYDMMTEENLDDWYAQSINRSIASMLNPQKKFYLPPAYEEELRVRYPSKPGDMIFVDEPYFKSEKAPTRKKMPSYLIKEVEKKKNLLSEHPCQAKLLQPKAIIGTPVKQRQPQDIAKPLRRRHAVLLINDIHYGRFLKKMSKPQQTEATFEQPRQHLARREMIYSFNLESMNRKNCDQPVPNSIIEREYERIKQPPKDFIVANRNHLQKQEEIQEKARQALNQKAAQAMAKIDSIVKKQAVSLEPISGNQAKRASTVAKTLRANATSNSLGSLGMEEKVLKLLNSMQVVSQHIDVQMANLNIHLSQITVQTHSNTIQHKWILKAEQKIKEREYVLAIDCYKQALILQQDSFIPIYNIAVLLEKEKMLTYAKDWLTLAKLKKTDPEKVSFGLALVQVKQLNFAAALKEIDELITTLEKTVQRSDRRKVDMTYYYLRALCYKKLEHFDKARLDYQIIIKHSKPSNYHSLSYFLLSVVFGQSRRHLKMKFDCLSYMNWRETLYLLFYEKGKRVKEEGLGPVELADRLSKLSFFNRFSKNLLKSLLEKSAYELIKKDTIIFASESESLILVSGLVTIWSHQNSITTPETVSVLGQGGIIGGGQIDNDLSSRPNYWFLAKTDLEVIKISREEFSLFWQGQITFEWDYKYNFLKNVGLFKGLPEATLFKLCEHIELKEYKYGQILFNDCSYRYQVLSKEGLGFCLAKNMISDPRFMRNKKSSKAEELVGRRRQKSKLCKLIRKNLCRFNRMKFNRLKYSGLFILIEGKMEVEDDRGFRCKDILSPRDYFGENLLIHSEGFHNYGRILVDSPSAKLYHLSAEKMLWAFTSLDKATMTANACNRKEIETLRFLRNRFNECLQVKMAKLMAKKD